MKHHANRDLREVYWQPDPELERLKKLRGEVVPTKVPYVSPPYDPRYGEYGNRAIFKAHHKEMERMERNREAERRAHNSSVTLDDVLIHIVAWTLLMPAALLILSLL